MTRRTIFAFLVSPAVVPLGVTAWAVANNLRFHNGVIVGSIYAAFTYATAVVLGIPAFYAFLRKGWTTWWQYAAAGIAIALAVLAVASAAAGESLFRLPIVLRFIATGAISTIVFWSIAIAEWKPRRGLAR